MILKTELTQILINLNDKGISLLKSGFENATNMFIENVNTIYDYLSSIAKELFNVQLTFEKESYSLSEASDFYINIFRFEPSFLFDTKKLIFYLPKSKANPIILTRVKDCAKDSVSRNITNILSDYAYKIRESNRTFKSDFSSKIEVIETDFKIFIEKIITERRKVNDQRFHKIKVLEEISFKLNNIANKLNN